MTTGTVTQIRYGAAIDPLKSTAVVSIRVISYYIK